MTEPTAQPSPGASASPVATTRREARLLREAQAGASLRGPQLAAPLVVAPPADSGAPAALGATPAETLALPVAAPIEPVAAAAPAPRRRTALLRGGAVVLLCLGLGTAGLWLLRAPDDAPAHGQDISTAADPDPLSERPFEGGGSPAPSGPASTTAPPATSAPPVEAVASSAPAPDAPAADDGSGSAPPQSAPGPAPAAPPEAPPQPPTAAPAPLAFTGITPNQTIGLLGIRVLSSYTLSLTGQPGATASVTYAGSPAGSVVFDGTGHASITVGAGALDLGIGNPIITAAYTDGTPGQPIQAHRNAI